MRIMILLLCLSFQIQAQEWCIFNYTPVNFDNGNCLGNFYIDTIANPGNLWQIGTPHKTVFTSGNWGPVAIVTDTLNTYPVNNTSSFVVKTLHAECEFCQPQYVMVEGNYQVDSDSLNDYGTIEFSPDNGLTWIDLLHDLLYADDVYWSSERPVLTGNSNGFKYLSFDISGIVWQLDINYLDTVAYRFSFFSDNIAEQRDGLMYDDFYFMMEFIGATKENDQKSALSNISPNPVAGNATIVLKENYRLPLTLFIVDQTGRQMITQPVTNTVTPFDASALPAGIYYYFLKNERWERVGQGRFVKT